MFVRTQKTDRLRASSRPGDLLLDWSIGVPRGDQGRAAAPVDLVDHASVYVTGLITVKSCILIMVLLHRRKKDLVRLKFRTHLTRSSLYFTIILLANIQAYIAACCYNRPTEYRSSQATVLSYTEKFPY